MLKKILSGVSAGIMISIGCAIFLACENRVVGCTLFAVALLTICYQGYSLYTGKIGFIPLSHSKEDFSVLLLGLLGNTLGVVLCGLLLGVAIPEMKDKAIAVCNSKLQQEWYQTLIRGAFCGVLMYIAVSIYKEKKSIAGIIYAIPVFMLSGFEHSIADMGYFGASQIVSFDGFVFLMLVVLGNTIGAMILPLISLVKEKGVEQVQEKKECANEKAS